MRVQSDQKLHLIRAGVLLRLSVVDVADTHSEAAILSAHPKLAPREGRVQLDGLHLGVAQYYLRQQRPMVSQMRPQKRHMAVQPCLQLDLHITEYFEQ